ATGRLEAPILASDLDTVVLDRARQHARQAGVDGDIEFQQMPLADVSTHRKYGCVICNPPYGERLGDVAAAEAVYRDMARVFPKLDTWSVYVLTSHPQFERIYGRKADRRRKLYNGRIECTYYQYHGPRPPWQQPARRDGETA